MQSIPEPAKRKALLALFGLANRDLGCALPSQLRIKSRMVEAGYDVDIYVYDMIPAKGELVDGLPWTSGTRQHIATYYESDSMEFVDKRIGEICREDRHRCLFKQYAGQTMLQAHRGMWSEAQVAKFIKKAQRRTSYDVVIALGSDFLLVKNINAKDLQHIESKTENIDGKLLFVSANNHALGLTNGIYVGSPDAVRTVLNPNISGLVQAPSQATAIILMDSFLTMRPC